jgi:hypothetical protein
MNLTIRAATPQDAATLERLAELDSRRPSAGHTLLAERGGVAVASLALTSGAVAADPFVPTADAVARLHERRYRLMRQGGDQAPVASLLRRLAPQPA